ncbi:MAG: hypothetical protein NTW21_30195 [Verrucomicrobia bacterium]|nr:hypothetical protein [Verrucomicrobiota bacterium]
MKPLLNPLLFSALVGIIISPQPAKAFQSLGTGNASLLGGDLTDPTDTVALSKDPGQGLPEAAMLPTNATWLKMTCAPATGPYAIPYQRHPYQSWVGAPAAAIFMNKPEQTKWYVSFKEGGDGGPSLEDPYFAAVQLKDAFVLTHFTITPSADAPDRDPREWAIQGSNTGEEGDWTNLYVCKAKDRSESAFQPGSRTETFLFTSFDSAGLTKAVAAADARKLQDKLKNQKIQQADFTRPAMAYTWFRIAIYSCFNPSAVNWIYRSNNGFALGQLELFGVPGVRGKVAPKVVRAEPPVARPSLDAPFIISYWCGPTKEQSNLERMKEIAECGFNVAQSPNLWEKPDAEQVKFNLKFLDLCQQAGIKAFIWDGNVCQGPWEKFQPTDIPGIEKDLDGMIARYSKHPALMGFVLGDEMGRDAHPRLGFVTQYLLKKDPTHLPYYNLLPNYAHTPKSYDRLVTDYLKVVKPALFSWDAYWQMHEENESRYYFDNLEAVRRHCLKAKTPFNQIIVSLPHMGYRECSEGDLRWQVWTSLAYGSRGIQYFTYVHVPGMATGDSPGLLTKDLKRDAKWFHVQKINRRIANLGPTLVKLTSTGVYHTEPPVGTIPLLPEAPVKKIEGGVMVIGCFKDAAGKVYILPVNRNMQAKITAKLTIDGTFVATAEVSQETGKLMPTAALNSKVLAVELEAGEGKLFLLNR